MIEEFPQTQGFGVQPEPATVAYAAHQDWPPVIPLTSVTAGLGGALLIGMLAGAYPSLRAARMTPTEALATT
ncbi:ABC transporter permease [Streptomyces canus]|uniref:ABC transporter permease n=1 Tax=Streptomyces canus TaxID=58343 RepID=UPI00352C3747